MIVATLRIQVNPENHKELLQTFRSLSEPIQSEKGCKSCRVYRELGNEQALILIQEWESKRHWDNHIGSNEFAVMLGAMSLLQEPETVEFQLLNQVEGSESLRAMKARNFEEIR